MNTLVSPKKKERMSNFDLMKIISMFFILIWHFIHNTYLLDNTTGFLHFSLVLLWFISIVHVNSFIISMGYFQCEKRFKFSRFLSLNNAAWFYKVLFLIIFIILGIEVSTLDKVRLISPLTLYDQYWFLVTYLILYWLSPFLNIAIKNMSKKTFRNMIIVLFIFSSILPTISGQLFYWNNYGHSIFSFVLLYYIGAYLKKYPINTNYYFKNITTNSKRLFFIVLFFALAIFNAFIYHYGEELVLSSSSILQEIGNNFINSKLGFDNPLVILQTICFFLFFSTLDIKNKKINYIASCTFAVYLIHDNFLVRKELYSLFFMFGYEKSFIQIYGRIFIMSILVFVICTIIESIRKKIFALFSKTKFSNYLRTKFLDCMRSLNINLNW